MIGVMDMQIVELIWKIIRNLLGNVIFWTTIAGIVIFIFEKIHYNNLKNKRGKIG